MQLSPDDVKGLARLARIAVSDQQAEQTLVPLNNVFTLIERMQEADTDGLEPMTHPLDAVLRLRVDQVSESDRRAQLQAVAPDVEDNLYLVPKVIE